MIAHALSIVRNELDRHLASFGGNAPHAELGNVAEIGSQPPGASARQKVLVSVVNIQEERTIKNGPAYVRDDVSLRVRYRNPPVSLNLTILVAATHANYGDALLALSRALAFFQATSVFTPTTVNPQSLVDGAPVNVLDRLTDFNLVFSLGSPTLEEVNDMWGMLGGKQFPFALYTMRMLELDFHTTGAEAGVITEVVQAFTHAAAVT